MKRRGQTRQAKRAASAGGSAIDAVCDAVRVAYPEGPEAVVAVVRAALGTLSREIAAVRTDLAEVR